MAKPTKTTEIESEILTLPDEPDDVELSILSEMNATDDDVTWSFDVNRVSGPAKLGNKEPFLFSGDASDIAGLKVRLRDECGTGTYRVRIKRNGILYRRFDISVETPTRIQAAPQSEIGTVLAAIQASNERTMQLLERMAERSHAPASQFDPVAMFAAMGTIMANFQKMIPPQQPPVVQPVMQGPNPQDAMKEVMNLFREGVEFAQSINPREPASGMTGILERLLDSPLLAKLAEGVQPPQAPQTIKLPPPRNPGAAPVPRPAPSPVVANSGPAPVPEPQNGMGPQAVPVDHQGEFSGDFAEGESIGEIAPAVETMKAPTPEEFMTAVASNPQLQQQIKGAIDYLISRSVKGSEPEFYAEWLLDNWPDELIDVILATPELLSQLQTYIPDIAPHRGWFERLLAECRDIVKDDAGGPGAGVIYAPSRTSASFNLDGDTGRQGRGRGDVGHHGQAGESGQDKPDHSREGD